MSYTLSSSGFTQQTGHRRPCVRNYQVFIYRPQRSCEGYVFTASVCRLGGSTWLGTPPEEQTPPRARYTPPWDQVCPPGPGAPPDQVYPPLQVHPSIPGTPPDQVHPRDQVTPRSRHPPDQVPPQTRYTPPGPGTPLPDQVHPRDQVHPTPRYGHCCGRYASYWNAFLLNRNQCTGVPVTR